jgi:hypothetical protein
MVDRAANNTKLLFIMLKRLYITAPELDLISHLIKMEREREREREGEREKGIERERE